MKKSLFTPVAIAFLLLASTLFGQKSVLDLSTKLAIDPSIRIGKLDNGLVYYIKQNKKPEKRVELRLVVNAGSILENDDQQGLAHYMEHMNFNGTKRFPKNELIDFLQKTGVKFGADINAYTSFDETVYMLQLPTDDTTLIEKGYQVLEDWAHNALLDDKEIDKERGIIIEEWRMGLGAQDRMMKKFLPVIFKDSRYATRVPIGKIEVLENFKHETLRSFYRDWYRPDLQAIVVVGDINPDEVEAKIKAHFAQLQNPPNERERVVYDLPDNKDPLIAITTDKEATGNMILMFYKHPGKTMVTLGDFKEGLMAELFSGMLNQRFNEISQKPESPFIFARAGYGNFLARTKDSYFVNAMPKQNQIDEALATLLKENERVKRFGFTPTEFVRQKEELLSQYEKASLEADKTESSQFASAYVANYLTLDPIPGAVKKYKYVKNILPEIGIDEVNGLVKQWVTEENMAMVIMAPDKADVVVPTESEVMNIITNSRSAELQPYIDNFREEPLVTRELLPAKITRVDVNKDLGYVEVTLSNGVTVVLKSTQYKNDEILFSGFSLGGHSLYPDADFMSANFAAQITDMSGAGNFDNIELQKKLKGKILQVSPYIDDVKEGFRGNAAPKDLETLMQLVFLYFDAPRQDSTAFASFMSQMENQLKFMKSNPIVTFYDTLYKTAYPSYNRMMIFPTPAQLEEINLDKISKIYRDRFANAGDFTFFFAGNFNLDTIQPLLEKYLGNLPSTGRKESFKDCSPTLAPGITNITVHKGSDPQSMVGIVMSEKFVWNDTNLLALAMLKEIISIKLIEEIREKLSGVYSPQVMINPEHYPQSVYQFMVMFGCSPKMTGKLTKAVFAEIKKLRSSGPTEVDLQKAKEALIRARETDIEKNEFWLSKLESIYYDKTNPQSIIHFKERVNSVTVKALQQAAHQLINPEHYVRVVLMPEKK